MTHPAATPPTAEQIAQIIDSNSVVIVKGERVLNPGRNIAPLILAALAPAERASPVADGERDAIIGWDPKQGWNPAATLSAIRPALTVLRDICGNAKLSAGEAKAVEMLGWVNEAIAAAPAERAEAVPDQLTKEIDAMSDIPRRVQIEKLTPAENAIRLANEAVEALPADVRLTGAQVLLGKVRALVADYVDGVKSPTRAGALDAAGADAADAARYRYLRDHHASHYPMTHEQPAEWSICWSFQQMTPEERDGTFDYLIDQDIERQKPFDAEDDDRAALVAGDGRSK